MVKILYLLAGIALKQTVDEIKFLTGEYVNYLKGYRDAVATFRPAPAARQGSVEAYHIIAASQHQQAVGPLVQKMNRKILLIRLIPGICYAIATIGLFIWIAILESTGQANQ